MLDLVAVIHFVYGSMIPCKFLILLLHMSSFQAIYSLWKKYIYKKTTSPKVGLLNIPCVKLVLELCPSTSQIAADVRSSPRYAKETPWKMNSSGDKYTVWGFMDEKDLPVSAVGSA